MTLPVHMLALALATHKSRAIIHAFYRFGLIGLFFISAVDASFVPLPIPGMTDIMVLLYAAAHANLILLVAIATAGSALGGLFTHVIGQAGGNAFLEKTVPPRILKRVTHWMERHAIISVALPAILPPPMPLAPFTLAAGATKMRRRKFMIAFTASRFARHAIAAWLGVRYGKAVLRLWNEFSDKWGATILVVFWSVIVLFTTVAIWKLVLTSRQVKARPAAAFDDDQPGEQPAKSAA